MGYGAVLHKSEADTQLMRTEFGCVDKLTAQDAKANRLVKFKMVREEIKSATQNELDEIFKNTSVDIEAIVTTTTVHKTIAGATFYVGEDAIKRAIEINPSAFIEGTNQLKDQTQMGPIYAVYGQYIFRKTPLGNDHDDVLKSTITALEGYEKTDVGRFVLEKMTSNKLPVQVLVSTNLNKIDRILEQKIATEDKRIEAVFQQKLESVSKKWMESKSSQYKSTNEIEKKIKLLAEILQSPDIKNHSTSTIETFTTNYLKINFSDNPKISLEIREAIVNYCFEKNKNYTYKWGNSYVSSLFNSKIDVCIQNGLKNETGSANNVTYISPGVIIFHELVHSMNLTKEDYHSFLNEYLVKATKTGVFVDTDNNCIHDAKEVAKLIPQKFSNNPSDFDKKEFEGKSTDEAVTTFFEQIFQEQWDQLPSDNIKPLHKGRSNYLEFGSNTKYVPSTTIFGEDK